MAVHSLSEFELIDRYFTRSSQRTDVLQGIGDDGAVLCVPRARKLVVTVDTLVSGIHFLDTIDPYDLGWKVLAVNLSDLAAMGAEPAWATLALTLPEPNEAWLQEFSRGFFELANRYNVALVGGDTTKGPVLCITLQAHGFVPPGQILRRSGARPGDLIYVTGTLGDAAMGLALQLGRWPGEVPLTQYLHCTDRLDRPIPRVTAGLALRDIASAAIDLSDGLGADLSHVLQASGTALGGTTLGAVVYLECLPRSPMMKATPISWEMVVGGGDDYELCFTVPPERLPYLKPIEATLGYNLTLIGEVQDSPGISWIDTEGQPIIIDRLGFSHFASP